MSVRPGLVIKCAKLLRRYSIGCLGLVIDPTSARPPRPQAFAGEFEGVRANGRQHLGCPPAGDFQVDGAVNWARGSLTACPNDGAHPAGGHWRSSLLIFS